MLTIRRARVGALVIHASFYTAAVAASATLRKLSRAPRRGNAVALVLRLGLAVVALAVVLVVAIVVAALQLGKVALVLVVGLILVLIDVAVFRLAAHVEGLLRAPPMHHLSF